MTVRPSDNSETAHDISPGVDRTEPAELPDEKNGTENGRENQVVYTKSVSIKGVLKGKPREIPVAKKEISEEDQVARDAGEGDSTIEVTEADMQRVWKEYAESIKNSHPRIFSTLNQQIPAMTNNGIIQIQLNTNAQREYFVHTIKPELTRYFEKRLANIEYVFETNLIANESMAKKVYTDQDKLDYLISKNPDLGEMKSRFNLDFDH